MLATTLVGLHGNQLPICGYCLKILQIRSLQFLLTYSRPTIHLQTHQILLFKNQSNYQLFCINTRQHIALFFPHKLFFGSFKKKRKWEKNKSSSLNLTIFSFFCSGKKIPIFYVTKLKKQKIPQHMVTNIMASTQLIPTRTNFVVVVYMVQINKMNVNYIHYNIISISRPMRLTLQLCGHNCMKYFVS